MKVMNNFGLNQNIYIYTKSGINTTTILINTEHNNSVGL